MPEFERLRERVSSNPDDKVVLRISAEKFLNKLAQTQSNSSTNKGENNEKVK